MRTITLEEHFASPAFLEGPGALNQKLTKLKRPVSADYPYSTMDKARGFLGALPVSDADRNRIAHLNAGRLLKL